MVKTRNHAGLLLIMGLLVAGYSLLRLPAATASDRLTESAPDAAPALGAPPVEALTAPKAPKTPMPMAALNQSLQLYLAQQPGDWGYYLLDLNSGQSSGQAVEKMFPAASTIKLPLALYIYDEIAQGRTTLDEPIAFQERDWQDGAGYLVGELSPGDEMSVGQLVEVLIRYSDNVAKNMLMRRFDQEGLFAWIRAHGGQVELRDDGDGGLIYTNAQTLAQMMRLLYADEAFRHPALREELLSYLESTVYPDRVAAGVPEGVAVAHKIGNLPYVVNDVALVWAPSGPFILTALSEGVFDEEGAAVIEALAAQSYQFLEGRHQEE